jgi:bifunctional UDP-N-acetylglucosamine pyrophosphorylase / glucosamine-1-phosphate N-acetyltransferase
VATPGRERPSLAVILAAGKGKRMGSPLPKVLHPAAGRPLLSWVIEAARRVPCERIVVIVGHGADEVRARFAADGDVEWVLQREQRGTGHALAQVEPVARSAARLLVLSGDVPLLRPATARLLLETASRAWGAMAVAELDSPGSLGRVVVGPDGRLERMVETADATAEELELRTINAGLYALPAPEVFGYLRRVKPDNAQGELYLTDALNLAAADGRAVECVRLADADEALGVNTPQDLALVEARLRERGDAGQ